MKILRTTGIVVLILLSILGLGQRAKLSESGLAAYQARIKPADVSVSVSQEGHVIKIEGIQPPGQVGRPCSATLVFESNSK